MKERGNDESPLRTPRDVVLGGVRDALRGAPAAPAPAGERPAEAVDAAGREALVTLLCERLAAYRAEVRRLAAADVGTALTRVCAAHAARRLVVPPGLPAAWRPPGLELVEDDGLSAAALDALDGVVTGCTLAVAQTGTLALTGAPAEGRRVLTLVPDLHVCVVAEAQVVAGLPQALAALAPLVRDERRPVVLVSGPSATSDIELQRVEGVHGPRHLVVLVTH